MIARHNASARSGPSGPVHEYAGIRTPQGGLSGVATVHRYSPLVRHRRRALPGSSCGALGASPFARTGALNLVLAASLGLILAACSSARPPEIPAGGSGQPPIQVGILLLDGVFSSELTAPLDVFHHTASHADPAMQVITVGRTLEPITTYEGLVIRPDHDLASAPALDLLVVPGGQQNRKRDLEDLDLIQWLSQRGSGAKFVMALGDGTFLLAEAGLLRDRKATTFPGDLDAFQQEYPHLETVVDMSFVVDQETITSAGGVRAFEPALWLVDRLCGEAAAQAVARGMVTTWPLAARDHVIVAPSMPKTAATGKVSGKD
jgi:putative intracellular protease/amidase